jgi:IPT/TIG domain
MKFCSFVSSPAFGVSALLAFLLTGCASSNSPSPTPTTPTITPATVTAVSPAAVPAGAAATTITVTGTNFISSSVVQVAGVSEATTYVSAMQLTASVPANLLGAASILPIAVLNGSTTSAAGPAINLEIDNPAPVLSSFTPPRSLPVAPEHPSSLPAPALSPPVALKSMAAPVPQPTSAQPR